MRKHAAWPAILLAGVFFFAGFRCGGARGSAPPPPSTPSVSHPEQPPSPPAPGSGPKPETERRPVRTVRIPAEPKTTQERFERAWVEFGELQTETSLTSEEKQARLRKAIGYARAAVKERPGEASYAESLAYMYMMDRSYAFARDYFGKARKLTPEQPRIALLQALASAAVVINQAERREGEITAAVGGFGKAAELDEKNSLPHLVAASVAFALKRPDLARAEIEKALKREELRLYFLPVPEVVNPEDKVSSTSLFYICEFSFWRELRSHFSNIVGGCIQAGRALEAAKPAEEGKTEAEKEAETKKRLEAALDWYDLALRVGKQVAHPRPLLYHVVLDALRFLEQSYAVQEQALRALGRTREATDAYTEQGVVSMARIYGEDQMKEYVNLLETKRPSSWAEIEEIEAKTASMLQRWVAPS
jgi:tetratricopeptide (TPR) repeat protein